MDYRQERRSTLSSENRKKAVRKELNTDLDRQVLKTKISHILQKVELERKAKSTLASISKQPKKGTEWEQLLIFAHKLYFIQNETCKAIHLPHYPVDLRSPHLNQSELIAFTRHAIEKNQWTGVMNAAYTAQQSLNN